MIRLFFRHVRGMHSNFITQTAPWSQVILGKLVPSLVLDNKSYGKYLPSWDRIVFGLKEFGYLHLHATKPDTLGESTLTHHLYFVLHINIFILIFNELIFGVTSLAFIWLDQCIIVRASSSNSLRHLTVG